jgi:transposase
LLGVIAWPQVEAMKRTHPRERFSISDELWARMEPLLPPGKPHALGCHNPRVPNRQAMTAILFVLRTGCQWNALNVTGICSSSSAHRRFVEWVEADVFLDFWRQGLLAYDELKGIDWRWASMDGAMTKAPLGGEKNRTQSDRPRQGRHQTQPPHRRARGTSGTGGRRSESQ